MYRRGWPRHWAWLPVRMAEALDSRAGRTDFVRAKLAWRDGQLWASSAGAQVSGYRGGGKS